MKTFPEEPRPLISRSAIRSFDGRLASIPGVRVTWAPAMAPSSMGGTKGDEAKLAKIYPPDVARVIRQVGGAHFKWETVAPPPGRDDVLRGWLNVPSVPAMLKHGFQHGAQHAETTFPADVRVALVDAHNDQAMAWLVVDADGTSSIRATARGEENNSRHVASTLDEYLFCALEAGCLEYWHDPARDPGALESYRSLPLDMRDDAEILSSDAIDEKSAKLWMKETAAAQTNNAYAKDIKTRAKTIASMGEDGLRLLRIRIEGPMPTFVSNRAVAALVSAPGAERLLAACAGGDPRFDFLWGTPGMDAPMPDGILAVRHHEPPAPKTVDVEILLASALVPQGAVVGAHFATHCHSG